jgi:sulfur relay (sulfurtransferase) complex TusBCD TusD component (DsrE family)
MANYLIIASRDPFESVEAARSHEMAGTLAELGNAVTVYLVQNGVFAARRDAVSAPAMGALAGRATVLADSFSMQERGIEADELMLGVAVSGVDELVELLAADGCVGWWN